MKAQGSPVTQSNSIPEWFASYRRYLLGVGYRMLGTYADAEDVVQDVFVRLQDLDTEGIREPKPYLTRMVVRRSLDVLKSARRRRETYVGPWLPEPDVRPNGEEPIAPILMEETISYALMVVLDRLTPGERAVFLLHEAFGYGYGETAQTLDKTEAACRQLMSRVRRKLQQEKPEPVSRDTGRELVLRFMQAASSGRMDGLIELLRDDVAVITDGGGVVSAAIRPILGVDRSAAFVLGLTGKYQGSGTELSIVQVNGETGLAFREQGVWTTVVTFEWRQGRLRRLYAVRNPAKLERMNISLEGMA